MALSKTALVFGRNLSKPDQSSVGWKGVVMIGPNSCRLEIEKYQLGQNLYGVAFDFFIPT